jgi:subtilisin family serine protease
MKAFGILAMSLFSTSLFAASAPGEWIVKFRNADAALNFVEASNLMPAQIEPLTQVHFLVKGDIGASLTGSDEIEYVQPNYIYKALGATTNDPNRAKQWGMTKIGISEAWNYSIGDRSTLVAVIDTGVDYNHEDLKANIWRNTKEIPGNGIDDDKNGYVDDVVGWDFNADDADPMDETSNPMNGGNPGHGTHCAGNVGAVGNNGIGISGAAQQVTIMPLRFLGANGQGTTAMAVKAIRYAVDNGATILSNSWGSEGPSDDAEEDRILRETIEYAKDHDVLFIAAAGNHSADNDNPQKAGYPASFNIDNIISVAASTQNDTLASFSCYGKTTVHLAAPGTAIYSTVPGNKYQSAIIPVLANWDGTSMAAPHVTGVAALIKSLRGDFGYREIKDIIMGSVDKLSAFNGKTISGGRLNAAKALQAASQK